MHAGGRLSRRDALKGTAAGAAAGLLVVNGRHAAAQESTPVATPASTTTVNPPGDEVIGLTVEESTPAHPRMLVPPEGAPNILFWVVDDIGFGQLSPYGGPIETPTLQRIVDAGLLYTNFHTTALCSPTRACLLTGRNHHANHMGTIAEISTGYPGYDARIPFENGFLSEMLTEHGYAAYAVGKWHLTPFEDLTLAGARDRWPMGRGFERYYGFLGGEMNQWEPSLVRGNDFTGPPRTPGEGYHLSEDLTDTALLYLQDLHAVLPDKPFFLYLAYGAGHAPHHVPTEWADRYRGRFDEGWDLLREATYRRQLERGILPPGTELPAREPDVPVWDELPGEEQRLYARMMEVFAGFVSHMDDQFGRVLTYLETIGQLDNTMIVFLSDNGASAEGGPVGSVNENLFFNNVPDDLERNLAMLDEIGSPATYNHYAWGWTWAGNAPFRRWKRETFRGGISDPFVIAWPKRIPDGGQQRTQYLHAIDVVPTVLEAIGIEPPASIRGIQQAPLHGLSFAPTFADAAAPDAHHTQYYEMFATRSIYHDGWRAVCPWPLETPLTAASLQTLDPDGWQLFHIAEDFAEAHDVAGEYPEKVEEMVSRWWAEAGKYNVLPLDGRMVTRAFDPSAPQVVPRPQYIYFPGGGEVAAAAAPPVLNRSHALTAEVHIPEGGAEGVLAAMGGRFGGYSLFAQNGTLTYVHNYVGIERYLVTSNRPVPTGAHVLRYTFDVTGPPDYSVGRGTPGIGRLFIDDELVGEAAIPVTVPLTWGLGDSFTCGYDPAPVVTDAYTAPFAFTGTINRLVVDVDLGS
jgi:arylsulfatase